MAVKTLAELRTAAQQRADMSVSDFITTDEWTSYINQSLAELHGMIVQAYGEDYFVTETSLSYAANAISAALPDGCFKVRGVAALVSEGTPNRYVTLRQYNYNTRYAWTSPGVGQGVVSNQWSNIRYRAENGLLKISPPPTTATTILLAWIPEVTELVDDADETEVNDSLNGWLEYVIVDAAIKAKDKQESDTSVLERQRERLVRRIEAETANRDAGDAETIRDVNASGNGSWLEGWW